MSDAPLPNDVLQGICTKLSVWVFTKVSQAGRFAETSDVLTPCRNAETNQQAMALRLGS